MNMYEVRKSLRKKKRSAHAEARRFQRILEVENIIRAFEGAYKDCYKVDPPQVQYHKGWYWIGSRYKVRCSEIVRQTKTLMARIHERSLYSEQ